MNTSNLRLPVCLVACLLITACADPEISADEELQEVKAVWASSRTTLDPEDRLSLYADLVEKLRQIPVDYPETRIGRALAAGQSSDGISIPAMEREFEGLKARASCYAKPTSDCLLPFASRGAQDMSANAAIGAQQRAQVLVCERGFASADEVLEPIRINRPAYAEALIQVALQAAQCRPGEVQAAITAYTTAEPAIGGARIGKYLGVLQNDALRRAWSDVIALIDKEAAASGMSAGETAGIDLTLAVKQAELGETEAGFARFNRVAQSFNVDSATRVEMASALLASGEIDRGLALARERDSANAVLTVIAQGARTLAANLSLLRGNATAPYIPHDGNLEALFEPVAGSRASPTRSAALAIEKALDEFIAPEAGKGMWLGAVGAETTYGILGLIHQKLGDHEKASALLDKGEQAREALARPGSYRPDSESYLAVHQILVALAGGDTDTAVALYPRLKSVPNMQFAIIDALAKKGDAQGALTFASKANAAGPNTSQYLMDRLSTYGYVREAEQVLAAAQFSAAAFANLAWTLVEKAAQAGKLDDAEAVAAKYNLLTAPVRQWRMAELKAEAALADDKTGRAEDALREMFAIGDTIDKAPGNPGSNMYAQAAATQAFAAGQTELGIELYQGASRRDQRPLLKAFSENTPRSDFPELLMLAHDNLRGEELGYVIDVALRRLKVLES